MTAIPNTPARAARELQTAGNADVVRPANFLYALMLFWLLPSRIGPRVTRQSLVRAFAAFVIAAAVTLACPILAASTQESAPNHEPWRMRESACLYIFNSIARAQALGWTESPIVAIAIFLGAIVVAAPAVAAVLTPWCADPADPGKGFAGALKLHFWAASILLPAAIAFAAVIIPFGPIHPMPYGSFVSSILTPTSTLWPDCSHAAAYALSVIASATVVLHLRALTMGAANRAGFAAILSPDPDDRFCLECAYCLRGLPDNSRCPECGVEGRVGPLGPLASDTLDRPTLKAQWRKILSIHLDVLVGRIAPTVARFSNAGMREFWWRSIPFFIIAEIALLAVPIALDPDPTRLRDAVPFLVAGACIYPTLLLIAAMASISVWAAICHRSPPSVPATICFHLSPLIWPALLVPPALFISTRMASASVLLAPETAGITFGVLLIWLLWFFIRFTRQLHDFHDTQASPPSASPTPDPAPN